MVQRHASCLLAVAAGYSQRQIAVVMPRARRSFSEGEASPRKTRVRVSRCRASGRLSRRSPRSREIATGYGVCGYRTASGQRKWLSRDPIGERGGKNLYGFAHNDPQNRYDKLGLSCEYCGSKTKPGSKCCPACEIDTLRKLLESGIKNYNDAKIGKLPTGSSGGELGSTTCTPPIFGSTGSASCSVAVDISSCLGNCVYEHEMVHVADCEGKWQPGNPYYDASHTSDPDEQEKALARTEAAAYAHSNACLKRYIGAAEEAIRRYGSADAACSACRCRQNR